MIARDLKEALAGIGLLVLLGGLAYAIASMQAC